jgi:hypothetical protein
MPDLMPLAYEAEYVSEKRLCKDCRMEHGFLLSPPTFRRLYGHPSDPAELRVVGRKIIFMQDIPACETITGYINLNVLPLSTLDPSYVHALSAFSDTKAMRELPLHLWNYYDLKNTCLTGTIKLSHYRHDSARYSSTVCRERLGAKDDILWMHPYFAIEYLSVLNHYAPASIDAQILRTFLHAGLLREHHHFRIDMGLSIMRGYECIAAAKPFFEKENTYPPTPHYVYLIQKNKSRIYKIGISTNPRGRLANLQTSNPDTLRLIHTWQVKEPYKTERLLHDMFAASRLQGEWFALSHEQEAELVIFMKQYKDDTDV